MIKTVQRRSPGSDGDASANGYELPGRRHGQSQSRNGLSTPPMASVIIPTYNREEVLIETIAHLLNNTYPRFELIVVDQTPQHKPEVRARLRAYTVDSRFRLVNLRTPSITLARNVGFRVSKGDIVIYCDDDIVVENDFVAQHVAAYEDAQVGAVAGRVENAHKWQQPLQRPTRSWRPGKIQADGWALTYFDQDYVGEVDYGPGCNMSFRRAALEDAGGFDERFTKAASFEQVDIFVRVRKAGYRAVFARRARAVHLCAPIGGRRSQSSAIARYQSGYRNQILYALKHLSRKTALRFVWNRTRNAYSACRIHEYPLYSLLYILTGLPEALWARYVQPENYHGNATASYTITPVRSRGVEEPSFAQASGAVNESLEAAAGLRRRPARK